VPGRSAVVTGLTVAGTAGIVAAIPGWFFSDLDPLSPLAAWRRERAARLTAAFAAALVLGVGIGAAYAAPSWSIASSTGCGALLVRTGLMLGLIFGVAFGAVVASSQSQVWPATLAFAQLARRGHTPFRLMRFPDDAHDRHVLREVGSRLQFRHARLQDRLAASALRLPPAAARPVTGNLWGSCPSRAPSASRPSPSSCITEGEGAALRLPR
jgi:hypothetical protein